MIITMKQNVQHSTALISPFLVFSLCLFLSVNILGQKPTLSATIETGGKSMQIQEEEETTTTNILETPTSIQSSSQTAQNQQKSGDDEITIDGPFCNGCDDPKGGSALACSGGTNSIIQGIDISSMTNSFLVNSIDFNQESFGGKPNVTVNLFCGTAETVRYSPKHTPLYTEVFTTKKSDDRKCVTFELSTPPTIDPACGTTLWIEFKTNSGKRVVATPKKCNGNTATGKLTYIRTPGCSVNTPKTAKSKGFKLDASFAINVTELFGIKGDIEYCASEEKTTLDAAGNWSSYQWSNNATTQTIEVIEGTYAVTVTDIEGFTATDEVTVIQHANPVPAITGELEYCAADLTTTLDVGGGEWKSHLWSDNKTNASIEAVAGNYTVTVTDFNDCTGSDEVEVIEYSLPHVHSEGTGMVSTNNGTGNKVYVVEVCGGTTNYETDFTSSDGYASMSEQPSPNAGCLKYQIVYASGVDWTLTVTDTDICEDKPVVYTNKGIDVYPELEIAEATVTTETCAGDEDGAITLEINGGDDSCDEYTYTWSSTNGFDSTIIGETTENTISDLASGYYDVTVTDCAGTIIIEDVYVGRANGRSRGRGGCKTAGNQGFNEGGELSVYPNPFGERTMIEFNLPVSSNVWLTVYSMDGRKVAQILEGEKMEGGIIQRFDLSADNLQNGLYIVELQTESGLRQRQQLMVVK